MVNASRASAKGLARLKKYIPETAFFENAQLVKKHFGQPPYMLKTDLSPSAAAAYYRDVLRRARGYPLQYLLGEWEFMSLPFCVSPHVLIPRPDTETLAEEAIRLMGGVDRPFILDLCTGSGCLAIAALCALPQSRAAACDISAAALSTARANALRNGVADRLKLMEWDILSQKPLPRAMRAADLVMCNPPYIKTEVLDALPSEVSRFEPRAALDGGPDGLRFYRAAALAAKTALSQGGILIFEHGFGQGRAVCAILEECGYGQIRTLRDIAGIERCAIGVPGGL